MRHWPARRTRPRVDTMTLSLDFCAREEFSAGVAVSGLSRRNSLGRVDRSTLDAFPPYISGSRKLDTVQRGGRKQGFEAGHPHCRLVDANCA